MRKVKIIFVLMLLFFIIIPGAGKTAHAKIDPYFTLQPQPSQEPVRGIYVQAANTKSPQFEKLLNLVNTTELNSMVIDIKNDHGQLTFTPEKKSKYISVSHPYIQNPGELIRTLQKNNIYPIARIVVFKDNVISQTHPNWSFTTAQGVWKNHRGDSFTNPFLQEVWDYNIGIAIEAAKVGFKEIQFDYVRFPEKFEQFESSLTYSKENLGGKQNIPRNNRVAAITEFVKYAKAKLKPYKVKMSVDTFGYTTVIPEASESAKTFQTSPHT